MPGENSIRRTDQFRAKEPRPCYYAVITERGSMSDPMTAAKTPDSLRDAAANAMRALAKAGGEGKEYSYRLVRNPDTAAFLVEVKNVFRGAGKYYPPTVRPYAEDARDGYTEEVNYSIWDTRTGELVARDTVRAPIPEQVITQNVRDRMFWIYVSPADYADSPKTAQGAERLRACTDEKVLALEQGDVSSPKE